MTDPVALVRSRALAVSAVTTIASTRIYSGALPQLPTLPAVLVRMIGRVQESHLRGTVDLQMARVQVHSVATTRDGALALANAIDGNGNGSSVTGFSGTIASTRVAAIFPGGTDREEWHAGELKQFEVIRDYLIHFER